MLHKQIQEENERDEKVLLYKAQDIKDDIVAKYSSIKFVNIGYSCIDTGYKEITLTIVPNVSFSYTVLADFNKIALTHNAELTTIYVGDIGLELTFKVKQMY